MEIKWADVPPERRTARWANVTEETHGAWLASVVGRMRREGCGYANAIEAERKANQEAPREQQIP